VTVYEQIESLLVVLKIVDDGLYEAFCEALETTRQNRIVLSCFQKYRVCYFLTQT